MLKAYYLHINLTLNTLDKSNSLKVFFNKSNREEMSWIFFN